MCQLEARGAKLDTCGALDSQRGADCVPQTVCRRLCAARSCAELALSKRASERASIHCHRLAHTASGHTL